MYRSMLFIALLGGCAPEQGPAAGLDATRVASACDPLGGTVSGVAFSDDEAVNAVDFADHATAEELDGLYGVGPAIADRIIAARPFGTDSDPLAALDAVAYVGPDVLTSFRDESASRWCSLDDGRQSCCAEVACEGVGGVVESTVEVTDAEAHMLLDWANRASWDELQLVCEAGPAIADGIVEARPLRTIHDLADVPWVGSHAIHAFLGDPDFSCSTEGSVAEEWCGLAEADCTCDGDVAQEPPSDPVLEDVYTDVETDLPVEVQAIIDAYEADNTVCDDQPHYWYPQFAEAWIYTADGVPTGYTVRLVQMIDPEGGIQYLIDVEIDAEFNEVGLFCAI